MRCQVTQLNGMGAHRRLTCGHQSEQVKVNTGLAILGEISAPLYHHVIVMAQTLMNQENKEKISSTTQLIHTLIFIELEEF